MAGDRNIVYEHRPVSRSDGYWRRYYIESQKRKKVVSRKSDGYWPYRRRYYVEGGNDVVLRTQSPLQRFSP